LERILFFQGRIIEGMACLVNEAMLQQDHGDLQRLARGKIGPDFDRIGVALLRRSDVSPDDISKSASDAMQSDGAVGSLKYENASIVERYTNSLSGTLWRETTNYAIRRKITRSAFQIWTAYTSAFNKDPDKLPRMPRNPEDNVTRVQQYKDGISTEYAESKTITLHETPLPLPNRPKADKCFSLFNIFLASPHTEILFQNHVPFDGIARPFVYVGANGSATPFHFEDGGMDSLFLSFGTGVKYWFFVARKDLWKILQLYPDLLKTGETNCGHEYFFKKYSPSIELLLKAGINVHIYQQFPGDLMLIQSGTLHEVKNIGPVWGVTKNYASTGWLEVAQYFLGSREECLRYRLNDQEESEFRDFSACLRDLYARYLAKDCVLAKWFDKRAATTKPTSQRTAGTATDCGWLQPAEQFQKICNPCSFGQVLKQNVIKKNLFTFLFSDAEGNFLQARPEFSPTAFPRPTLQARPNLIAVCPVCGNQFPLPKFYTHYPGCTKLAKASSATPSRIVSGKSAVLVQANVTSTMPSRIVSGKLATPAPLNVTFITPSRIVSRKSAVLDPLHITSTTSSRIFSEKPAVAALADANPSTSDPASP
jgi:JmjC domain, hydroxylase